MERGKMTNTPTQPQPQPQTPTQPQTQTPTQPQPQTPTQTILEQLPDMYEDASSVVDFATLYHIRNCN